jgi:hypothetical protein
MSASITAKVQVRLPRGRDWMWEVIRDLAETQGRFTVRDVHGRTSMARRPVEDYCRRLAKGGWLEHVETGAYKRRFYRLRFDQPDAPRPRADGTSVEKTGACTDQLWRTMAMLSRFRVRDLAIAASTAAHPVAEGTARRYCRAMARAGYLVTVREATGAEPALYFFPPNRRTGPIAPRVQATELVYDPNTGWIGGASDLGEVTL